MSNLCIFSRAFYPAIGGLERIAQLVATEAVGFGHQVEVVTDTIGISNVDDQHFPFRIIRTSEYQTRVKAFKRADIVLMMNISLPGLIAAWYAGVPVVATHHSCYEVRTFRNFVLENLKRYLMRFITNISCSRYVAQQFGTPSTVIPNAYDDTLFTQPAQLTRTRDFLFCGRLVSDKGADVCLRAFARVLESAPDATLTLVGDGSELQSLQTLAKRLGVASQVSFTGALRGQELVAELQCHACMVVPSLWEEPFGIVALEGIACCDTVIVSRRGGLPEAVGDCGLVVEPSVEELAVAMVSVVNARRAGNPLPGQPSDAMRKAHLVRHTPEAVTRQYLDVVGQAIARKQKRDGN